MPHIMRHDQTKNFLKKFVRSLVNTNTGHVEKVKKRIKHMTKERENVKKFFL